MRIEIPGAHYHVMARGNRRGTIFHDDDDRRRMVKRLDRRSVEAGITPCGVPVIPEQVDAHGEGRADEHGDGNGGPRCTRAAMPPAPRRFPDDARHGEL
ncbi:MAG: hypothetical protein ACQCXQ_15770 [Verrucomicrobiales bacterium]|nr:hypothetical protein [Verrucomicrobiota bacterium JB025]